MGFILGPWDRGPAMMQNSKTTQAVIDFTGFMLYFLGLWMGPKTGPVDRGGTFIKNRRG